MTKSAMQFLCYFVFFFHHKTLMINYFLSKIFFLNQQYYSYYLTEQLFCSTNRNCIMVARSENYIYILIKEAHFIICKVDLNITFFHVIFGSFWITSVLIKTLSIVAGIVTALVDNTLLPSPDLKLLELLSFQ